MERADPHATRVGYGQSDTLAHLGRGFVREGDGKHVPRPHVAIPYDVCDALREHARLTRTSTRKHEQWSLRTQDSLTLRRVKPFEVYGHVILHLSLHLGIRL